VADTTLLDAPFYLPTGDEVELFTAAYSERIPVLLKGPTGCGKTRFVENMAWRLTHDLITVTCHDDMTASDLVGRYLEIEGRARAAADDDRNLVGTVRVNKGAKKTLRE